MKQIDSGTRTQRANEEGGNEQDGEEREEFDGRKIKRRKEGKSL